MHSFSIGTPSILFLLYFGLFIFGIFAFCFICILSHLHFVTFVFLSHLYFVTFVFCHICILSHLYFFLLPSSAPISASAGLRWSLILTCPTHPDKYQNDLIKPSKSKLLRLMSRPYLNNVNLFEVKFH